MELGRKYKFLSGKLSSLETQFEEPVLRMKSLRPETVNTASKSSSLLLVCSLHTETIYFHNFVCLGTSFFFKILHYVTVVYL